MVADSELPVGLKDLVGKALELLGKAILVEYGLATFEMVESIRQSFKEARDAELGEVMKVHARNLENIRALDKKVRYQVAHSFAISLELINACENAYRTFRLRQKERPDREIFEERITFVLTAHPTESRSPECIALFTKLTYFFIRFFEGDVDIDQQEAFHLMLLFLKTPVARTEKPQVADEAEYIYSISLRNEMIHALITTLRHHETVFIRSWVGGDKDGHPGINAEVMEMSLSLSRKKIIDFVALQLEQTIADLELLPAHYSNRLEKKIRGEINKLKLLRVVRKGDGGRIAKFHTLVKTLGREYLALVLTESPHLSDLQQLLFLFPGLVVTLELRENSGLVHEANEKKNAISEMLCHVHAIAQGGNPRWYARGFVVSSTESANDILAGVALVRKCFGALSLPVIPLFESEASLKSSRAILDELFDNGDFLRSCRKELDGRFEIMLGYSDSAKESGSLASRMMIHDALFELEACVKSWKLIPIFFHGSGGSVARGGGSLEEQVAWWPESSRKIFKVTIQGEMVYRSFAMPEIFRSQARKILYNSKHVTGERGEKNLQATRKFAAAVSTEYQRLIADPNFLLLVEKSTPYEYLNELRIGSRPAKRSAGLSIKSLRAIPWVLCWTQMRSNLPIWWGIGKSWAAQDAQSREALAKSYRESKFFASFVKLLAFSLAKVDLAVWFTYLHHSQLDESLKHKYQKLFENEFDATLKFVRELTGEKELLWFRPWLEMSIRLRSTMIHPLNMAQLVALESADHFLLRETVTGVASGMLTTG